MEKTYGVKQIASILGYSTNSIYTFLKAGRIVGIRVGKGRYRISQEELDKLLHLKKTQEVPPTSTSSVQPFIQSTESPSKFEEILTLDKHLEKNNEKIPCLFDWFVSLVSIIIGLTMILFVHSFEGFSEIGLMQFLIPIKINFLIAGIGLFLVNIYNWTRNKWYFIFMLIIFLNLFIFSLMLFFSKDLVGFTVFALILVMIFFHLILNLRGTVSFATYVSLLTIILPVILIAFPSTTNLIKLSFISSWPPILGAIFWLILACAINVIIWVVQDKQKPLFLISLFIFNLILIYIAYLYATQLYWGRSLIIILIFLTTVISSFWHKLNFKDEATRGIVINIFGDLLIIFLAIISIIWGVQNNIQSYGRDESINKLNYGKILIETTITSSKEKLITLSKDDQLIEAVEKKDSTTLKKLAKDLFIYSLNFRRILIVDSDGNILDFYPEASLQYENIAFRDYFINVKAKQISYLSNLFVTEVNGINKEIVVIASPIINKDGKFIGALIGSLDIDSLTNKLQQSVNYDDKEYYLILDRQSNLIVKPEGTSELSDEEINQLLTSKANNNYSFEQRTNSDSQLIQVHELIADSNWILVLRRSLVNTLNFNNLTNLLLNLTIVGIGLLTIFWNFVHLKKRK